MNTIFFLALSLTQVCRDKYLDRILESKNQAQYFLVLKVKVDNNQEDILVLNNNLYNLIRSKDSSFNNFENYRHFIKDNLNNNKTININRGELMRMNALVIKENKKVNRAAAIGRENLFKHYLYVSKKYNYARLNPTIKHSQRIAIIKILFEWNFFIETVEGDFSVPELDFCGGI